VKENSVHDFENIEGIKDILIEEQLKEIIHQIVREPRPSGWCS
jgi:hypothetical protein